MPSPWIGREMAVNDEGKSVERRTRRDIQTGDLVSEEYATDYKVGVDGPAFTYVSSEANNDRRWQEVVDRKKEKYAEQLAEQQREMEQLEVANATQATSRVKDEAEMRLRASVGRKTFGGLGGLLGPNGSLTRKDK